MEFERTISKPMEAKEDCMINGGFKKSENEK